MQSEAQERTQAVFDHTQKFWKEIPTKARRDPEMYARAVHVYVYGNQQYTVRNGRHSHEMREPDLPNFPGVGVSYRGTDDSLASAVYDHLTRVMWSSHNTDKTGPRRVLKSDLEFPTNKTTRFRTSDNDGFIGFDRDRSTVSWAVSENNHAVDSARNDPMFGRLVQELEQVRWTRGTGGVITGNDEYNRDDHGEGGGSNYVTDAFGPIGAERAASDCREFTDSKGVRHTRRSMADDAIKTAKQADRRDRKAAKDRASGGPQGRVSRGVPSGGQFSHQHHGESGLSL